MATHVRKNITLPRTLDNQVRAAARKRGTSQSSLVAHLVEMELAAEEKQIDRLLLDHRKAGLRPSLFPAPSLASGRLCSCPCRGPITQRVLTRQRCERSDRWRDSSRPL